MQKIIEFLQMLAVDINVRAQMILAILHLPVVALLIFLARQERGWLIRSAHKKALLFVLGECRVFCMRQYHAAMQCLKQLNQEKSYDAALQFAPIAAEGHPNKRWALLFQNPSVFLYHRYTLKPGVKLFALRDSLGFQQESTHDHVINFSKAYKQGEQRFYDNLLRLIQMDEMLEDNLRHQSFNQGNEPEWMADYIKIFEEWKLNGAARDLALCYEQIVVKILHLTGVYREISFIIRAAEYAFQCDLAYTEMIKLKSTLKEKLDQFAWYHRLAARMLTVVIRNLEPRALVQPLSASPPRITERRLRILEQDIDNLVWLNITPGRRRFFRRSLYILLLLGVTTSIILALNVPGRIKQPPVKTPVQLHTQIDTGRKPVTAAILKPVANIYGIDVSKYQGDLLKDIRIMDSLHFVICKASEGITYVDPDFATNWKLIRQKGLIRGAYHFYRSCDPPIQQAQHFLHTLKDLDSTDMPPVVDVEVIDTACWLGKEDMKKNLLILLHHIEQTCRRRPVIYTTLYFADTYLTNPAFANYPLWLAEYSGNTAPRLPRIWMKSGYAIWQRTDSYTVDSRKTDFDVFNGNHNDLLAFIKASKP